MEKITLRGCAVDQVEIAVQTAPWEAARWGRQQCFMDFPFGGYWRDRYYRTMRVNPIFAEEEDYVAIVTVLVYYF